MKKEYAINVLNYLKYTQEVSKKISNLGVDLSDFTNPFDDKLEQGVALLFSGEDEACFEKILKDIQWWLYDTRKIIYMHDTQIDVSTAESFINWIDSHYQPF